MTVLWIIVIIFIVVAVGAGIAQLATAWGDKKISNDVTRDTGRLHADHREDRDDGAGGSGGGPGDGPGGGPGDGPGEHGNH
jgi:hypothetical protein